MFEWQVKNRDGEWVTEPFVQHKVPSTEKYSDAALILSQPLTTVITMYSDCGVWVVATGE